MVLALVSGYALWIGLWIGLKTPCVGAFVGPKIMSPVTGAEVTLLAVSSDSFLPRPSPLALLSSSSLSLGRSQRRNRKCRGQDSGRLRASMLLDFIKKRAQEGVEQTQNLVTAAQQGRLEEALKETSEYVKDRYRRTPVCESPHSSFVVLSNCGESVLRDSVWFLDRCSE